MALVFLILKTALIGFVRAKDDAAHRHKSTPVALIFVVRGQTKGLKYFARYRMRVFYTAIRGSRKSGGKVSFRWRKGLFRIFLGGNYRVLVNYYYGGKILGKCWIAAV